MSAPSTTIPDWFMYHGGYGHGGYVASGSSLSSSTVNATNFGLLNSVSLDGSILSVPAVVDGYIYVGVANSHDAPGSNGGALYKIDIQTGAQAVPPFIWDINLIDRDSHGFTGMGCTPTVLDGKVYFIGFNARLYCLNQSDLSPVWEVDLRYADAAHNQPVTNIKGMEDGYPPAAGWCSPMVAVVDVDGVPTPRLYVGVGEGENPNLYSFINCIDPATGDIVWIYCTCQFEEGRVNAVNELPAQVLVTDKNPAGFTVYTGEPFTQGCSVWAAIAYDAETGLIYASTGQPALATDQDFDQGLPSKGWSSGILALHAATGEFVAFTQMPAETAYRPTDLDVDIGSAPTVYTWPNGQRVVGVGCKNGGFMVCDALTLELLTYTSLLPRMQDGSQIPEVDPHPAPDQQDQLFPMVSNDVSNANTGENYFGPFNTAAVHPPSGKLFVAIGGPNYHFQAPGIDYKSTPFMKAIDFQTLEDAWPLDNSDPQRYANVGASMYTTPGESGLSSPAVVNDVVFVSTSKVAIYAFKVSDGSLLWASGIGSQTGGLNGGYGYCLGPAIYGNYVVAGALVQGLTGGILNIYGLLNS